MTLVINLLKIFDLVYVLAPDSSQSAATVVAVEIYRTSFGGGRNEGLSSALGVLLFLAVIPAMLFNVWRLRRYRVRARRGQPKAGQDRYGYVVARGLRAERERSLGAEGEEAT